MARKTAITRPTLPSAPNKPRDQVFCREWLEHFDAPRAYREAGFSLKAKNWRTRAFEKLRDFHAYLEPLRAAKVQAVAEQLVINQQAILEAMAAVAFPKIEQYLVRVQANRVVEDAAGKESVIPAVDAKGEPIYVTRLKPLHELTPAQLLAVEVYNDMGGNPQYKIPTPKVRHMFLESLGKQMGMFTDKLILQRHEHTHQHAHLHLQGVAREKLDSAVKALLPVVGAEFARELGFSAEEFAQASEGVVITLKSDAA